MRPDLRALAAAVLIAAPAAAWEEPARGTPLRAAILDAVRPLAAADLGPPVEFVVHQMRVAGDRAFVSVHAQRPGGVPIDMARTPLAARGGWDPDLSEGASLQALLQRTAGGWAVAGHAIGATDVWWADPRWCAGWRAVIADVCP